MNGIPLTRYWLIPPALRPKVYAPHPLMSASDIRRQTQETWDRFYRLSQIWQRAACVRSLRSRLAFVLISKLYRQMYANTGIATDSARGARSARWARWLARPCRRLFIGRPMPHLEMIRRDRSCYSVAAVHLLLAAAVIRPMSSEPTWHQ